MTTAAIRKKLIADINKANDKEVKEIFKLHSLVMDEKMSGITWRDLSADQQQKITTAITELDEGKGIPATKAIAILNKKYGIQS